MVVCNLGGERQVVDELEHGFELVKVVSAELESPEVILGVPWAFSLIVVRDCIQRSSVLRTISGNDADNMRIWPHDNPSVVSWDAPPPVVSDNAGREVNPVVEVEA